MNRMTHQEAIGALAKMFPTQMQIAKHIGTSQQHWSQIKRKGRLPAKYWKFVGAEPVVEVKSGPIQTGFINADDLTISQARHLYEQLKEVFG